MNGTSDEILGRSLELERIKRFLEQLNRDGEARMVSGEPGVGKSALLETAARQAELAGIRVLRVTGSEFEADVSYSSLHQLLLSVASDVDDLPPGLREALTVALGLRAGDAPDRLVVCNAVLALLRKLSAERPVLLLVDDLHWVDRASALVLSFVARRVAGARVGLVGVYRFGTETFFDRSGLSEVVIPPLDEEAAAGLLDLRYPSLAPGVRRRVLDDAQGNPLALLELPWVLSGPQRTRSRSLPEVLPLSERLQALFSSRVAPLPERTYLLLLLAVFEGSGDLRILQAADQSADLTDLAPAERARLIHVDGSTSRLAFRHPLIRSAVVEMSTYEQRRRAHAALAATLSDQPERRAWHLAEAATGVDEGVAALLEQAAYLVMGRGDAVRAMTALVRAAELSPSRGDRARRLAEAAYIGAEASGDLRDARTLLADARRADPDLGGSLPAACAAVFLMINSDGDVATAHRLLVGAIEAGGHGYRAEDPALLEALHTLALLCWYGSQPGLWAPFYRALDRLTPQAPALLRMLRKTFPDPVRTAAGALEEAGRVLATVPEELDMTRIVRIGTASVYIDRLADLREGSWRIVYEGRGGAAARRHIGGLMHLCLEDFLIGQWAEGEELADEGLSISRQHGFPFFAWYFLYHKSILAAGRGRFDQALGLADEMSAWAVPRGVRVAELWAHHPRTLVGLGQGDFEAAFRHASAISPAGTLASHIPHSLWLMLDLVEAALHTGRAGDAQAHVDAMREADVAAISPRIARIQAACSALAANGERTPEFFEAALSTAGAGRWRYDEARIRLAYGEWLRRTRASLPARNHLLTARDLFRAMGAAPWVDRAEAELRAAGERVPRIRLPAEGTLTAQERAIAQLAAGGLTNKEIAERLYLSPRTVSTHLYRIFPKLGVSSRAALRDALDAQPAEERLSQPDHSG